MKDSDLKMPSIMTLILSRSYPYLDAWPGFMAAPHPAAGAPQPVAGPKQVVRAVNSETATTRIELPHQFQARITWTELIGVRQASGA